jgi:membrane protease YdiL (CAAX protease family)
VLSSVVFAPVIEEPIFRGAVMRGLLSRTHATVAITIQGVLFGAVHFDPDYGKEGIGLVIALSVAGIGLGTACYLMRRLGPVIIAHAVLNSVAMMVVISRWY